MLPMKFHFKRHDRRACFLLLVTMSAFSLGRMNLSAETGGDNIASADKGAYVSYSTPLQNGAAANNLVTGQTKKLNFANKNGLNLFVINLGKTYKLGMVQLKFTKPGQFRLYVFKTKPGTGESWQTLLAGAQPQFIGDTSAFHISLGGLNGEYLVFVCDRDLGAFYGLYVTGIPFPDHFGPGFDDWYFHHGLLGSDFPIPGHDFHPPVPFSSP
jgi:hypothetical protein